MLSKLELIAQGSIFSILLLSASPSFADCIDIIGVPSAVTIIDNYGSGVTTVTYTINGEKCSAFAYNTSEGSEASSNNATLAVMLYDAKIGGKSVGVGMANDHINYVATPR